MNIKVGDRVRLTLLDKHRTRTIGIVIDMHAQGTMLSVKLSRHYKCWAWTRDVVKVT